MEFEEKLKPIKKPLMVLGTSSGAGKSLTVTAICRILKNYGEEPIPFKGQNMSNNAWVDWDGGEMAYSQAHASICLWYNSIFKDESHIIKTARQFDM